MTAEVRGRVVVAKLAVEVAAVEASQSPHAIILTNAAVLVEDVMAAGSIDLGTLTMSVRRYEDHYWIAVTADRVKP